MRSNILVVPGGVGGCVGVGFSPCLLFGVAFDIACASPGVDSLLLALADVRLPLGERSGSDGGDAELLELAVFCEARLA